MLRHSLAVAVVLCCAPLSRAEHITLNSGREFDGSILQQSDTAYTFKLDHGTVTIPKSVVKYIVASPPPAPAKAVAVAAAPAGGPRAVPALAKPVPSIGAIPGTTAVAEIAPPKRMPAWDTLTTALARQKWATGFTQIPATVVDKGQMRFVPYSSYRCGADYEMNVYGDPDAPAGIEIGVYRDLLKSDQAKANCIEFIASVLGDKTDEGIVRVLNRSKDLATHTGLTIEVTPSTDEDAYGGWWISVYDEKALEAARATPEEIRQITVAKADPSGPGSSGGTAIANSEPPDPVYGWSSSDVARSRPSSSIASGGSGGSVYVRGYYRSNGTYVNSYTRAAPGTGAGHSHGGGGHR